MVTFKVLTLFIFLFFSQAQIAMGMLPQTSNDFITLEDALQNKLDADPTLRQSITPMLVAQPKHLWEESRSDFAPAVWSMLKKLWSNPNDLIQCQDCNLQRLHTSSNHTITIDTGELTLADLNSLTTDPRYNGAKSVVFTTETASGIEFKLIRIQDGAIVIQFLADSRVSLSNVKPRLGLAKELDRRLRGESLSYVFIDLGFYPQGLVHISFLEQWGSRNQHITGLTLSLINPTVALGINYRYMLPANKRISLSGHFFVPLEGIFATKGASASSRFAANFAAHYAFSSTFGVFIGGGTSGGLSLGVSMYNPIWFPFML